MQDTGNPGADDGSNVTPMRRTRLVPAARGVFAPVVTTLGANGVARAFQSDGGWLHVDGAAVSQGSLEGTEPLRAVASVRDAVDRLSAMRAVMEHLREREVKEDLAYHVSRGLDPEDHFPEEVTPQIHERYPIPDEAGELAKLGWYRIETYRQTGSKFVGCVPSYDVPSGIRRGVRDLATVLGCKTGEFDGFRPSREFEVEPEPGVFADMTADDFAGLPGFAGYDPETRVVSFHDRDVTVTLPGGLGWTPPEGADGYPAYR